MKKINQYVFIQIFKSCTLIFFIFVSIAWLLQISRLFSYLSNFQVKFLDILNLSIFLLPNIINVILPFIVIFGIIIAFIKMDKDKEIIAIYNNYPDKLNTEVLVASIRSPLQVAQVAQMGADVATIPPKIIKQMIKHPLTDIGLNSFMEDWKKTGQTF